MGKRLWWKLGDAWNAFCAIYGDHSLPWGATEDAWDDWGVDEQIWAIREGLAWPADREGEGDQEA